MIAAPAMLDTGTLIVVAVLLTTMLGLLLLFMWRQVRLIRSDAALHRAKANGRDRVDTSEEPIPTIYTTVPSGAAAELREAAAWPPSPRPDGGKAALTA